MSENNEAPVAASARDKRAGAAPVLDPAQVEAERLAKEEKQKARKLRQGEQLDSAKTLASKPVQSIKRHPIIWTSAIAVVVLVIAGVVVENVSAHSAKARDAVVNYVAVLNDSDTEALASNKLFPKVEGADLLPADMLKAIDTTIVDPKIKVVGDDVNAKATISSKSLSKPIILKLHNTISWEGLLLQSHWSVVTKMPTVTFAADGTVPADANLSFGDVELGTTSGEGFSALNGKTFSAPFGKVTVKTSATAFTTESSADYPIVAGENTVTFGAGPVVLDAVVKASVEAGDVSALAPLMADKVKILTSPSQVANSEGGITSFEVKSGDLVTVSKDEAIAKINSSLSGLKNWAWAPTSENWSMFRSGLTKNGNESFISSNSIIGEAGSTFVVPEDSMLAAGTYQLSNYVSFTTNADGKIDAVWLGIDPFTLSGAAHQ